MFGRVIQDSVRLHNRWEYTYIIISQDEES